MPEYVTLDELRGSIPAQFILEALDDDNDGVADDGIWAAIRDQAQQAVDAPLAGRFSVPFAAPFPALVSLAAKVFSSELIYRRRGVEDEKNPWLGQATMLRKLLTAVGENKSPAPSDFPTVAKPAAVLIAEPSRTAGARLSV